MSGRGFWLLAAAFAVNMLGTTLPTPLYPIFEQTYGFGPLLVTIVFAVYAYGVLAGLLCFGELSDDIGRKRLLIAGLVLSFASAAVFLFARDLPEIFVGRILSGLSAGVFTGSATAALVDLAPPPLRARATAIAVAANMGGLSLGTLLSGLLAQYAPDPLRLSFAIDLVLCALAIVAVALAPESVRNAGKVRFRIQRLRVPPEIRSTFLRAAYAGMCGFAVAGLFSAVAPSYLESVLGYANHAIAGALVFVLMSLTAAGQILVRRFARERALLCGAALLFVGIALLAIALLARFMPLLFLSAVLDGLGAGLSIGAGLAEINERITERRGEVSSAYFVLLYIGLAFPVIGVGALASSLGLAGAGLVFCAVIGAALVVVMLYGVRGAPASEKKRAAT